MIVYGFDSIVSLIESDSYVFKLIANDMGVVLFPSTTEHRDATHGGIEYSDDSLGNALAGMVKPGKLELRFHERYSDERTKALVERMLQAPELAFAKRFAVTYQARTIISAAD